MDQWTAFLRRVVLVANRKGGVLKSSVCRSVASVAASNGYKVLVVDGDPQGNLSEIDFGLETDRGRSLAMAMQYGGVSLQVSPAAGVDVVCGGAELQGALGSAMTPGSVVSLGENLRTALGELCAQNNYDLVLIDSGPGDTLLLDAYLHSARWLVVPTVWDEASFAGVDKMGARYAAAKQAGAEVEFLGAVLTKMNHRASSRNRGIRDELAEALGAAADPFEAMIRYNDSNALDARKHGMSAQEVAAEAVAQRKSRLAKLRTKVKELGDEDPWRSRDGGGLAGDYEALTREILTRINAREVANA